LGWIKTILESFTMLPIFALIIATITADGPEPAPVARASYYLGESKVFSPAGRPLGNLVTLTKREIYPAESKIVETVLTLSSNPREPSREFVAVSVIEGPTFKLREKSGAFSGSGELTGKAWAWHSWTTNERTQTAVVRSETQVTDRGLTVNKELVGLDGGVRARYKESHASIDGGTYELFHDKLVPQVPPPPAR
jgi:hypothetical protein